MPARCWTATPQQLVEKRGADSLEDAFIGYLLEAGADESGGEITTGQPLTEAGAATEQRLQRFSLQRLFSYSWREALELRRDPVRATLALAGSILLMFVIGFGITLDVEDLRYAVLDRDQTTLSQNYALNISGSRYFIEQPPLHSYAELICACAAADFPAIEIPAGLPATAARPGRGHWCLGGRLHAAARRDYPRLCTVCTRAGCCNRCRSVGGTVTANAVIQDRYRYNRMLKACRPWCRR